MVNNSKKILRKNKQTQENQHENFTKQKKKKKEQINYILKKIKIKNTANTDYIPDNNIMEKKKETTRRHNTSVKQYDISSKPPFRQKNCILFLSYISSSSCFAFFNTKYGPRKTTMNTRPLCIATAPPAARPAKKPNCKIP